MLTDIAKDVMEARVLLDRAIGRMALLMEQEANDVPPWFFPIGTPEYPPDAWYIAARHDLTGAKNNGYKHTGIDLNVQAYPRGDIDRGQPVYAVTDAVVHAVHHSVNYLGSVVLKTENGLYIRYWHLMDNETFRALDRGTLVSGGECLGHIGNYKMGRGGDHLHFDMAWTPFYAHWWFTRHPSVEWCDPVPILKQYLNPSVVDAMLAG